MLTDDGWVHNRCDEEIEKFHEKSDKARASVQKRWGDTSKKTQSNNERNTDVMQTNNERNTNQEPLTKNHIHPHKNHEDVGDKSPRSSSKFEKPSFNDVCEHMKTKISDHSNAIREADKFWNYYESNGWKVGKNPMKNWGAACNQWVARNESNQARASPTIPTNGLHDLSKPRDYAAGINPDGSF